MSYPFNLYLFKFTIFVLEFIKLKQFYFDMFIKFIIEKLKSIIKKGIKMFLNFIFINEYIIRFIKITFICI